jgi:hypothetical protein
MNSLGDKESGTRMTQIVEANFGLGFILLGVATIRADTLPRWGGLLLIIGAIVVNLPPQPVGPFPKTSPSGALRADGLDQLAPLPSDGTQLRFSLEIYATGMLMVVEWLIATGLQKDAEHMLRNFKQRIEYCISVPRANARRLRRWLVARLGRDL